MPITDDPIYLDHNATTPVAAEVAEAMWPYLTGVFGNPSSTSPQGAAARRGVDRAREQVAALLGAHADEIVFTSGGTESNNLAIRGAAEHRGRRLAITSAVEHPATAAPLRHLRDRHGWRVTELGVDGDCRVRLDDELPHPAGLGTLILAHNETGTIQPMRAFAELVRERGGVTHADAAQAAGKIPVNVDDLGVDLLSIAGHKMYAPKGVGALYVRRGTPVAPVLLGAGQENGLRPGTENAAGIVALGAAAELAAGMLDRESRRQAELRDTLAERLAATIPGLVRVTPRRDSLPNTLMVAVPGVVGATVLDDATAIAASTGSACHAGTHTPSAALLATGLDPELALGALRLSLGRSTTPADVETVAETLAGAVDRARRHS
ncbi:cysteine desulfurase family protein [Gordonia sp. FQ]|uniref:cysteine desulfurase family protein n=1 Tax=Gordonia sp. FQ TaxID=3446634 RepID=UPI003F86B8D0